MKQNAQGSKFAILIKEALAQPEPEYLAFMDTPQRKPLTNGEIYTAYITATDQTLRPQDERLAFAFARAIEAAHGIKGGSMNEDLINRITYYLSSGGLFNPELADHLAVRNLLMECREALAQRTWVGLTDEDIGMCLDAGDGSMSKIISFY